MKEMILVGRGGEGVVLASQLLAETFARAGFWVQAFPEFKAERRGAPISAFLRWDADGPIRRRYRVRECDVLAVVTPSPPGDDVLARVRPGGVAVLNRDARLPLAGAFDLAHVPASTIAREHGVLSSEGRPMGNTALLGALVRLLLPDGLEHLEHAIELRMGARAGRNLAAARAGYERCTRQHTLADDARLERGLAPPPAPEPVVYAVSTTDSLAAHTGSWSLDRPVVSPDCTACGVCALFCPEGAIERSGDAIEIDYLYCKGCGICEVVCPVRNALAMEQVPA